VATEAAEIEELLFEDQREDGTSKHISAYPGEVRQRLSRRGAIIPAGEHSRPAGHRGDLDEAAFHADVGKVIEAVNALLDLGRQDPHHPQPQPAAQPLQRSVPGSRFRQERL